MLNNSILYRYYTDPSGTFWQCNAKAIGSGSEGADSSLQEQFNKVLITWLFHCPKRITESISFEVSLNSNFTTLTGYNSSRSWNNSCIYPKASNGRKGIQLITSLFIKNPIKSLSGLALFDTLYFSGLGDSKQCRHCQSRTSLSPLHSSGGWSRHQSSMKK